MKLELTLPEGYEPVKPDGNWDQAHLEFMIRRPRIASAWKDIQNTRRLLPMMIHGGYLFHDTIGLFPMAGGNRCGMSPGFWIWDSPWTSLSP